MTQAFSADSTAPETLSEAAYRGIRERLRSGQLAPGAQLVNRTLASELGLSLTPVREAINRLASEGVVEYLRGSGAYVRQIDRDELSQIYDLREVIEPFAAVQAALRGEADQLREMRRACREWLKQLRQLRADPSLSFTREFMEQWNDGEVRFHTALVEAAQNRWLSQMVDSLRLMQDAFIAHRASAGLVHLQSATTTTQEHLSLYVAIRDHQPQRAESVMKRHIANGRRYMNDYLDGREREPAAALPATEPAA